MIAQEITPALFRKSLEFIASDVFREVQLAAATEDDPETEKMVRQAGITIGGAGNFLCAVGLLCYTDFAARLWQKAKRMGGNGEAAFKAFFKTLGPQYESFQTKHNVYDWIRGGMVHHYYMKKSFGVSMRGPKGACGISEQPDGTYLFIVAAYATDLLNAMAKLEVELFPAG
jgi:hypothetical protein